MPLRATYNDQDFFSNQLTTLNRKNIYGCPNCESKLIPVIPTENIIKHFRHKTGRSHYEHETKEHLTGKHRIFEIAISLGLNASTEYRIGNHITDVFIESHYNLAIEFQCSKCNSKEIEDRINTYETNGVKTLWILGINFQEISRPINNLRYNCFKTCKIEDIINEKQDLIYYNFNNNKFFKLRSHNYKNENTSPINFYDEFGYKTSYFPPSIYYRYDFNEYSINYLIRKMVE